MAQRRIGEVLVGGRAISPELRDRVLAQQSRMKGRFGTNLLEIGGIREDLLLRALSVQHGTPPASGQDLSDVRPDILRLVPAKLANSLFVVPFKRSGRTLQLAMRDPKDLPAIDEIAFLTGLAISPFVALDFRIQVALGRYYGAALESRYQALADRMGLAAGFLRPPGAPASPGPGGTQPAAAPPHPAPAPVPPPPPPQLRGADERGDEPRPPSLPEGGDPWAGDAISSADEPPILTETLSTLPPAAKPAPPISSVIELDDSMMRRLRAGAAAAEPAEPEPAASQPPAPEPVPVPAPPAAAAAAAPPEPEPEPPAPPRSEPEPEPEPSPDLASALSRAESRDEIASAVLAAAARMLRRAALFIAQPDRVIGWAAVPEPPEGLRSFSLAFSEPSLFASLRNTDGFYLGPSPDLPGNRRVLEALGASAPAQVAVVPVTLKGKSVLFLFGEVAPDAPPPAAPELRRLAAKTAIALEILLLRNRLRSL